MRMSLQKKKINTKAQQKRVIRLNKLIDDEAVLDFETKAFSTSIKTLSFLTL